MSEPLTAITDYLLAVCTAFWAVMLLRRDRRLFALAFGATAIGALAGGTWHGGLHSVVLWKTTLITIGIAAFALGAAVASAWMRPAARNATLALLLIQLAWYLVAISRSDDFQLVIADYASVMIAILIGSIIKWRDPAARWLIGGIVVSFGAAAVQSSSLHAGPLNHNDVYHLIEISGLYLLYRGGAQLTSRPTSYSY